MVRGKQTLQDQGKVREFYLELGKIDVLKKIRGKLKQFNKADLYIIEGWKKHLGTL